MRNSFVNSVPEPLTAPELVADVIQRSYLCGMLSHDDAGRYLVSARFLEQPELLTARATIGMQRLRDALKRHVDLRLRDGNAIEYVAEFLRLVGYAPDSEARAGHDADITAFRAAVEAIAAGSPRSAQDIAGLIGIQWFAAAVEIERIAERLVSSSLSNAHTTAPGTSP